MANLDLVYQTLSDPQSPTYSRPAKCGRGQAIQARPSNSDRMVPPSRDFSNCVQQVAPASNRSIRHEVQQQVASVCVPSTRFPGHCSRCTQSAMGGSGCICLPTSSPIWKSIGEVTEFPMQQNNSNCPGVAKHALVPGPGSHVQPDPIESTQSAESADTALQSDP